MTTIAHLEEEIRQLKREATTTWDDGYTWIHHRSVNVECSACHRSVPRASTEGPDAAEPGWGSIGKGTPPHLHGPEDSNPPFSAWTCPACNRRFEEETGVKVGDPGWLDAHGEWTRRKEQRPCDHCDEPMDEHLSQCPPGPPKG